MLLLSWLHVILLRISSLSVQDVYHYMPERAEPIDSDQLLLKVAVIRLDCVVLESELKDALRRAKLKPVEFWWDQPNVQLIDCAAYIITGDFPSIEGIDQSRASAIAALDPMMQILKEQSQQGKPVLGIGSGAQILVEAGLVPGVEGYRLAMALTDNQCIQAGKVLTPTVSPASAHVRLADDYQLNAFTRKLTPKIILSFFMGSAAGCFVFGPALSAEIQAQGLHVFQYCDEQGQVIDEFPINPNGSLHNIAAISNKAGNVMAIVPHPESDVSGDVIFQSLFDYIKEQQFQVTTPLYYYPRPRALTRYQAQGYQWLVNLPHQDDQALQAQDAFNHLGVTVSIQRQIHWEIVCDSEELLEEIKLSGVLVKKEKINLTRLNTEDAAFLVRPKANWMGQQKQQILTDQFKLEGVKAIHYGMLWYIAGENNLDKYIQFMLSAHLLFNPYSHDAYRY